MSIYNNFNINYVMNKCLYYFVVVVLSIVATTQLHSQVLVKENIFDVDEVKQEYDYWCVHACIQSVDGIDQCSICEGYINDFIVDAYESDTNPYSNILSDDDYKEAMKGYIEEGDGPCSSPGKFENFGVIKGDTDDLLGNFDISEVDSEHFIFCILQNPDESVYNYLLVNDNNDGSGHCVVLSHTEYYDEDWYSPYSHLYIMNPSSGKEEEISYSDLMDYDLFYEQKN